MSAVGVKLNQPRSMHMLANGDIMINDMRNERIRLWDVSANTIETIVGNGVRGYGGDGGPAHLANINFPNGTNPEPGGEFLLNADETIMYIADSQNNCIRWVDLTTGTIDLLAGLCDDAVNEDAVGAPTDARFFYPADLALDEDSGELFVADTNNNTIKVIDLGTGTVSRFAGTGVPTCTNSSSILVPVTCDEQHFGGDGGPAIDATLYRPFGIDLDLDGNLVIADTNNQRLRIVYR
jgi:sugar lactone lactonase YvrE